MIPTGPTHALSLDLPGGSLQLDRVKVMGILNITPDSFFDRGRYGTRDLGVSRAVQMLEEGADIIDVGGEKAGPGPAVSVDEELERVVPVIEAIRRESNIPISIDTFKPEVARQAVGVGAAIINGIGGMQDPAMRAVARDSGAAVVIMHIQGKPRVAHPHPEYGDVVEDVVRFLRDMAKTCIDEAIEPERIILDPGPGFGKTAAHDITLIRHLDRIVDLGYPVLLAASRKPFIGEILGLGVEDRLEGSLAATTWAVLKGVKLVRTHDVRATRRVVEMTEAVLRPDLVESNGH